MNVIYFAMQDIIVTSLAILILILSSIWSKTWILIFLPIIMFAPEIMLDQFAMQDNINTILRTFIPLIGIAIYFFISVKLNREKGM